MAKAAIDEAREAVSERLGASFPEVLFTSSGTESAALAIVGAALGSENGRSRIVLGAAEHHCVLNTRALLERLGFEVSLTPVDRYARIELGWLEEALSSNEVLLVAAMHANNELGTFNPVTEIGELCRQSGTLFFCDAVQTFGKVDFSVEGFGADLISVSAHKLGGPKGVGALYVRPGTKLKALISGGGQERELRGGTENVAAIAGFGEAARQAPKQVSKLLSDELEGFLVGLGAVRTVPLDVERLSGHVHVRFPGVSAETFLIALDRQGVSAGSGAACSSGSIEPSHVLLGCGMSESEAKEGVRFTLGAGTTIEEIQFAKAKTAAVLDHIVPSYAAGT